jgi:hypothetical protein
MPKAIALFALVLVGGYLVVRALSSDGGDAGGPSGTGRGATPPAEKTWGPDEMAKDPEGYLAWADKKIQGQVEQREQMLATIATRRTAVKARQQEKGADLQEWEDFLKRLETAVRRAQDEDRWPVQVGGRRFEKERALQLLQEVPAQVEKRRPLAEEYAKLLQQMDLRERALQDELERLKTLRERIALDVERVRLGRGAEELKDLGKSAEEIEHFAKILGSMNDIPDEVPAEKRGSTLVSLESLLK